jgi:hypothetical protein
MLPTALAAARAGGSSDTNIQALALASRIVTATFFSAISFTWT